MQTSNEIGYLPPFPLIRYVCVAPLCAAHSQLDAYFIIRFSNRANHPNLLATYVVVFLRRRKCHFMCVRSVSSLVLFASSVFIGLFNIRIRLRRCNDGIMIIAAKMAKDLKCDNACGCDFAFWECRFCIDCLLCRQFQRLLITSLNHICSHTLN